MNLGLVFAAAGLLMAGVALPVTWANLRRGRGERTAIRFRQASQHVREQQPRLYALALAALPDSWRADGIPMITQPGWIFSSPIATESVRLIWQENAPEGDQLKDSQRRARGMMPRRDDGSLYTSYSQALVELSGMSQLYNGWTYRPVAIDATVDHMRLTFTAGRYFDHLDTTEVLAYEAAERDHACKSSPLAGPYRRYLGNPFDLSRRSTSLGTNTLTIRVGDGACGFYMHQRNSGELIVGPDILHVVPAGEFTPADIGLESRQADFKIWRTVMREFAEEFLNIEEAYGRGGRPLDYEHDAPLSKLAAGRRAGSVRLSALGLGLDPLTWKPELLMVCAIDAEIFDDVFADLVAQGREGTILVGPGGHGIPFTAENVHRYAEIPHTRSSARSCLTLAWRHRAELGLGV